MIRRINFMGAPSSGKSTIASEVFATLKKRHYNVALIFEHVKDWVFSGMGSPESFDQAYLFCKEMRKEDICLRAGIHSVQCIITDGSLLHIAGYASKKAPNLTEYLLGLNKEFDKKYKPIYIYLNRATPYQEHGRFENVSEAREMDEILKEFIKKHCPDHYEFLNTESEKVIDLCIKVMENDSKRI